MNVATPLAADLGSDRPVRLRWYLRAFPLVFALGYATTLADLPMEVFKDRNNYLVYAQYSNLIFVKYLVSGILSLLANEPLWLLLNINLSRYLYPDQVVRVLIFVPAFIVAWQLTRRNPRNAIWMVIFLLSPQVVKNHIIHLRQGVALSVFLLGYFARPVWLRVGLMAAAGFIHSSFLVVGMLGLAVWLSQALRDTPRLRAATLILSLAMIGGLMGVVAGDLGARQAVTYADADLDISGLGFLFWCAIMVLFASSGAAFLRRHMFAFCVLVFYLVIYFLTPVAARIFESGMFLVFLAAFDLPPRRRLFFLFAFTAFTASQYLSRIGQPWLGWGL
jgi:hypothetical protein